MFTRETVLFLSRISTWNEKFLTGRLFQLHSFVVVQSTNPGYWGCVGSRCTVGGRINGTAWEVGRMVPSVKKEHV